jgi:hypothetical protein
LSWSLVHATFSLTLVGSLELLAGALSLLPDSADTVFKALMSMATLLGARVIE